MSSEASPRVAAGASAASAQAAVGAGGLLARLRRTGPPVAALVSRILAALFGGYALAALFSVAVLALPMTKQQAVITGMLGSFIVYACTVIWVFAVRSATRAWVGLLVAALPLLLAAWPAWTGAPLW